MHIVYGSLHAHGLQPQLEELKVGACQLYVWIGRSRFKRRTATSNPIREVVPEQIPYANVHGEDAMEDEQGRDRGCAAGDEGPLQEGVWTLPELRATLIEEREAQGLGKPKSLGPS